MAAKTLTITLDLTATYQDKRGHVMTMAEALDLFHGDVVKAIFLGAGKKAATTRDAARRASGAAPQEMRLPGNLPPEVATMLATVRTAIATAVPAMAPKAPSAPKAAPVPALDLSDPLEVAVSEELTPAPSELAKECRALGERMKVAGLDPTKMAAPVEPTKAAPKMDPKAVKAALAATAPRKPRKLTAKAVKAALAATEPTKVEAAPVPTVTPEIVKAAPPVVPTTSGVKLPSNMDALRAKQAARIAAKQAAKV